LAEVWRHRQRHRLDPNHQKHGTETGWIKAMQALDDSTVGYLGERRRGSALPARTPLRRVPRRGEPAFD
jgi:hypothetical protein